jgi:UDP-N-acetylmuramyl tripeptide synthase
MRLATEIAVVRAVGALSRRTGRGGGTTLPGKLLLRLDEAALAALARRLPEGVVVVSATNGKTTTCALAARILGEGRTLAYNTAGANLLSGVVTTLLEAGRADLALLEVDEAALPEVARRVAPRALCLGNLFRDQLDRYGELESLAERWRATVAELPPGTRLVANADDPVLGALAGERPGSVTYGIDDIAQARPSLQHAADSKYCVRCGTPYDYAAAYVGHLGDYRCPGCGHARPPLTLAARSIVLDGLRGATFDLVAPDGMRRITLPLPGLYNVYNAAAAAALCHTLGVPLDAIARGLEAALPAWGRFERIAVGGKTVVLLLVKNPAGANEAVRTLLAGAAPPQLALVALNDALADGRDVSWIWDVDYEPLLDGLQRVVTSGGRAAELALRFRYGGLGDAAIEVIPDLEQALDRALALTPDGGELVVLPTYTAMLALRRIVAGRGYVSNFWEAV